MELNDLQHGMQVKYQTGYRKYPSKEIVWSDINVCELFVMRREKDLPKKYRRVGDKSWAADSILIVATPSHAEFRGEDYMSDFGYFYNGEEDYLRIIGLGDEIFSSGNKRVQEEILSSRASELIATNTKISFES